MEENKGDNKNLDNKLERFFKRFDTYKEEVDSKFNIEDEISKLIPESGSTLDFIVGPNKRKEGESFKQYKFRQKVTNYILRMRQQFGVQIIAQGKGNTFVNPKKQQAKSLRKMISIYIRNTMKNYKRMKGVRMPDAEVRMLSQA